MLSNGIPKWTKYVPRVLQKRAATVHCTTYVYILYMKAHITLTENAQRDLTGHSITRIKELETDVIGIKQANQYPKEAKGK